MFVIISNILCPHCLQAHTALAAFLLIIPAVAAEPRNLARTATMSEKQQSMPRSSCSSTPPTDIGHLLPLWSSTATAQMWPWRNSRTSSCTGHINRGSLLRSSCRCTLIEMSMSPFMSSWSLTGMRQAPDHGVFLSYGEDH